MNYTPYQSRINRKVLILAGLLSLSTLMVSCGGSERTNPDNEAPPSTSTEVKEETKAEAVDLAALIGTESDGWLPKVLTDYNLNNTLTPEQVEALIPGAGKIKELPVDNSDTLEKIGLSEVPVKDVAGLQGYKLTYWQKKSDAEKAMKLRSITLIFDAKIKSDVPYKTVAEAFAKKYGPLKEDALEKKLAIWIGPGSQSAVLRDGFNKFDGYEFEIDVPES